MKVTIIGAGAMGGLFGSVITEAGLDVQLVDIWPEHVEAIKQSGLQIENEGQIRRVKVDIYIDYRDTRLADLVIVFVKGPQTVEAAKATTEMLAQDGVVLTLQNGLGNADILAETIEPKKVITGTTSWGSTILGPGSLRHAGVGPTVIGPWAGCDMAKVKIVAEVLNAGGIETEIKYDVKALVWKKLFVNLGINAIVALTHIRNGQILDLEITKELSRKAVEEGMAVAEALGIAVEQDAAEHCWWVAEQTANNGSGR